LTHLRQSWNSQHCRQGNQHEKKHQYSWSFIHGFVSIFVSCPENASARPVE
jgi:hypothetical protein